MSPALPRGHARVSPETQRQVGDEVAAALKRLHARRSEENRDTDRPPLFDYRQEADLAHALAVFNERQRAYGISIDQGIRDLARLERGERPASEQEGLAPWPELVEELQRWHSPWTKRLFDLVLVTLALIWAAPTLAVIALAIRLTSRGPVLFSSTHVGKGGRAFRKLKFRTMSIDAATTEHYLLAERNEALFKAVDDPRLTRVGRFLRRSSLDELPQLVNIVRGEMSFVGPRPLTPDEFSRLEGWARIRLKIRPGMTGPWQLSGQKGSLSEMIRQDYLYAARWSFWRDVKYLIETVPTVLLHQPK